MAASRRSDRRVEPGALACVHCAPPVGPIAAAQVPRVGIGVVVLRRSLTRQGKTEVLMIRRANEPGKGKWSFPGGKQELGETIVECAVREVREETGLVLRQGNGVESLMGCATGSGTPARGPALNARRARRRRRRCRRHRRRGRGPPQAPHATPRCGGRRAAAAAAAGETGAGAGPHKLAPGAGAALVTPEAFTAVDAISRDASGAITFHYTLVEVAAVPVDPAAEPSAGDDALDAMWCDVDALVALSGVTRLCPKIAQEAAARYGPYI